MTPAQWLQKIGIDYPSLEALVLANKKTNHAHYPPSDEPLSWDTKGKVVTLDHAIMAAHLMTARLVFGGFRSIAEQALRIAQTKLQASFDKAASAELSTISGIAKKTTGLALEMAEIFSADQAEASKELRIRKESLIAQRDVFECALSQAKKPRKRRTVQTRHRPKIDRRLT